MMAILGLIIWLLSSSLSNPHAHRLFQIPYRLKDIQQSEVNFWENLVLNDDAYRCYRILCISSVVKHIYSWCYSTQKLAGI